MLIICLAILSCLFNNNNQFDKTYFIRNLLNNKVFNAICVDYYDADFASGISVYFSICLLLLELKRT